MRAAVKLRRAKPGADLPDPAFVDRLGRRLRQDLQPPGRSDLSRRGLFRTAGTAVAAVALGAVADHAIFERVSPGPMGELVPGGARWVPVVAADAVADGQAVRFSTGAMEGYVVNQGGELSAVSAVCTHQGCILQWNGPGRLSCPCHRTAFSFAGEVVFHELSRAPARLARLRSRVIGAEVEVFVV